MTALTFAAFQASRTASLDIAIDSGFPDGQPPRPGFVYADGCYIETLATGNHFLQIERSEFIGGDLDALEAILWQQWYLPNHDAGAAS